jgi:hypothetical protein
MEWSESGNFVWSQRLDLQRVDRKGEQIVDAGHHLLMALESRYSGKRIRHDQQRKVPGAAGGAGMAGMVGAVVPDFEGGRGKVGQSCAQRRGYVGHDFSGR